jgi:hypothetical protein
MEKIPIQYEYLASINLLYPFFDKVAESQSRPSYNPSPVVAQQA